MQYLSRLHGMKDWDTETTRTIARVEDTLCSFLACYGYRRVNTPVLEQTELLMRKSGGELASKMYTFTDPGGHRVSLRPEFTSSMVRAYVQGIGNGTAPVRWSYLGPVFRYEPDKANYRQFTQAGAEFIGVSGAWVDAEVMAVACKGLSHLGITAQRLVVGHVGFITALLESLGLSDRARLFLLSNVATLSKSVDGVHEVRRRAVDLGLLSGQGSVKGASSDLPGEVSLALMEQYIQTTPSPIIGVRTVDEIRERFLRKHQLGYGDGQFDRAIDVLSQVVRIHGNPNKVRDEVLKIIDAPEARREIDYLIEMLHAFSYYDVPASISVDLGLVRGIAYYTGVTFEIQYLGSDGWSSIGGGGRYDGLVQALGGVRNTPAMGFAWPLEQLLSVLMSEANTNNTKEVLGSVLVRPSRSDAIGSAVHKAEQLRAQGLIVEVDLCKRTLKQSLGYAQEYGIRQVITVDGNGKVSRRNTNG
ncbi:ATP phosphoribosyltransferase regulatory subunit [Dehalococcoidia bacterium]|nr:ATP phosphoribosyltransferase regulatory subunit [Dehalococcoidia bacterium]